MDRLKTQEAVKLIGDYTIKEEDSSGISCARGPVWGSLYLPASTIAFSNLGVTVREAWEKNHGRVQT